MEHGAYDLCRGRQVTLGSTNTTLERTMRDALRTNDRVELSLAIALPKDAAVEQVFMDVNIPALEGSIGISPRRLIVPNKGYGTARGVLLDAEILDSRTVSEN